jgi:aldehyde:ferredoxin oxidoreductase
VDNLEARFVKSNCTTAVIVPAGENRVLYASMISDRSYAAARMGMGAVMGSKQLKSVVLRGDNRPPVADAAACAGLTAQYEAKMRGNPLTRWQLDQPGFSAWVHLHGTDAALCARNYTQGVFEGESATKRAASFPHYLHDDGNSVPAAPMDASEFFDDPALGWYSSGNYRSAWPQPPASLRWSLFSGEYSVQRFGA